MAYISAVYNLLIYENIVISADLLIGDAISFLPSNATPVYIKFIENSHFCNIKTGKSSTESYLIIVNLLSIV